MLDGLLSLSLPFQGLLGWRAGCCAATQAFFNFCGVVALFLRVIFSFCFFFLLLWGQLFLCMQCSSNCCQLSGCRQHFQRVLTFVCEGVFCVPIVREMSGFLICLVGYASHFLNTWKWDPGQRDGLRFHRDLCEELVRYSGFWDALSVTAETAETSVGHSWCFSRMCSDSVIVSNSMEELVLTTFWKQAEITQKWGHSVCLYWIEVMLCPWATRGTTTDSLFFSVALLVWEVWEGAAECEEEEEGSSFLLLLVWGKIGGVGTGAWAGPTVTARQAFGPNLLIFFVMLR